jgi:tetratricopeptide (TPR) repeat protein
VVSCLLEEPEVQPNEDGQSMNTTITCVTSRHGDKAGNGKSTLAIAVIQTVEVRERFCDGIAWLKLGPAVLTERDVRRLYEDLYRQLIAKETDMDASVTDGTGETGFHESLNSIRSDFSEARVDRTVDLADSSRRFYGGDLEGIKEDLARMIVRRNVLICLDDVWRVEDAKWFIFETPSYSVPPRESPYKILITTRMPALMGNGAVQEVFVRIFSEHEAVKLLLSTAGRRPYGGRASAVFNQSKVIVKGCGNSPLGILLVGSMLRQSSRNWNLNSPVWMGVFNQCSLNLEEAAHMRSFKNAFTRIVDLGFFTIEDDFLRIALRRCFVLFAMAFRSNDWMLSGRGIPHSILLKFFGTVLSSGLASDKKIDPKNIVSILENLKLILRTRHSVTRTTSHGMQDSASLAWEGNGAENSEKSEEDWDDFEDMPKRKVQQFYTMHDSLKAVAERMAERNLPAFTPHKDEYTYFSDNIAEEKKICSRSDSSWSAPLRFVFGSLHSENGSKQNHLTEEYMHELVAISLVGGGDGKALSKKSIKDAMRANQLSMQVLEGGDKFEEYTTSFLPEHLMYANAHSSAAVLLTNADFVRRRMFALGIMEATSRQVADILDIRNYSLKGAGTKKLASVGSEDTPASPGRLNTSPSLDIDTTVCDASRIVIDEVYKVTNSMGSSDSLGMATCLVTVGETLLKCKQARDAMLRLEEGVSIFRGLLGPYHVYVAHALHSVAKALSKLGETRVALLKFAEAARIYETCNATLHYDSISNAQALASLLVDIGDVRKAEAMFEEVIVMKQTVYGDNSVPVAKTINSYAILLAKHGRMNDALRHYEIARNTYLNVPPTLIVDPEGEAKSRYEMTLITLNIASIYSKKGDLKKALQCYEDGVQGLEEIEEASEKLREGNGAVTVAPKGSSHKHIVSALGRIGSIKAKLGDAEGSLEAYLALIDQVDDDSPIASHVEKAKAHIKCATLFRKRDGEDNRETAVGHLKEALRMYKILYAPNHKDTVAIANTLKQWQTEEKEGAAK